MISTITIESKKRYRRMFTAMVLCVSLLIGSAFALTPSYQKVSMPDPYGVMPLSLNDDNVARTFSLSSGVVIGSVSSTKTLGAITTTLNGSSVNSVGGELASYSVPSQYGRTFRVPAGTVADLYANVSYSPNDYQSLIFSGGGKFLLQCTCIGVGYAYPDTVQILVNGAVVGDKFSVNSSTGAFTLSTTEVSISSEISTIGFRFVWNSQDTSNAANNGSSTGTTGKACLLFSCTDNVSVTSVEAEKEDPYIPLMLTQIGWLQSIYSGIQTLGDSLSSSLGSVGDSASRIASVFARDDDIQLRDDVDDTLKEVTTQFYDQTSTSSSSMTVETVQNVKGIADGMDAMFSSGYSVSDAFTEIADNDDFMSWFTAETAQALDSTGNVAAVGDDPYNMHYYYDQVNAIAERRGD